MLWPRDFHPCHRPLVGSQFVWLQWLQGVSAAHAAGPVSGSDVVEEHDVMVV